STEALDCYGQAIQTLTLLAKRFPQHSQAREYLRNSHYNRASILTELQRFAEAMPDWDRAVALDDSEDRPLNRMSRAQCLAHIEPEKAVADAEDIIKDDKIRSAVLYHAAIVCAQASGKGKDTDQREQYAARAVALLQLARARGHFQNKDNFESLKTDT